VLTNPWCSREFGLDRDAGLTVDFATTSRDKLYAELLGMIEASAVRGGRRPGRASGLWAAKAGPRTRAQVRPTGWGAGEMPQEASGLNTVFDATEHR